MGKTLRPPVKWHGGKRYLCHRIIAHFPPHHTYVEPFGGAASVLLNKPVCPIEVYNDLDERIARLFRVLRDHGEEFRRLLSLTQYSEVEFNRAREPVTQKGAGVRGQESGIRGQGSGDRSQGSEVGGATTHHSPLTTHQDEIEQARRDFVRWRMSLGGRGDAFSFTLHRIRRGMADVVSGYLSLIDHQLPDIIERLRRVQIVCRPAVEVIRTWDSPETLIYCDPPYVHETRHEGSREVYGVELFEDGHRQLADALKACKAKVVLSGYASPLYEDLYRGWRTVNFDIANHAAGGRKKARKQEVLWLNWREEGTR